MLTNKRELTKKHIFDFETKYRSIFSSNDYINPNTEFSLKTLDMLLNSFHTFIENGISEETCFEFLDDYKDVINWDRFLDRLDDEDGKECYNLQYGILENKKTLEKFIDRYHTCFNENTWDTISEFGYLNDNIAINYKDKLNWSYASNNRLSKECILELKDYIEIDKFIGGTFLFNDIRDSICNFVMDHLEEALNYTRKDL